MTDPDLHHFLNEVSQHFDARHTGSFWQCTHLLKPLMASGAVQRELNRQLRCLRDDPHHLGDWLPNEWVLHRGGGTVLSVMRLPASRLYIHALPFFGIYGVLGGEPLIYDRYRLPEGYRNDVFDASQTLVPDGSGSVHPGEILPLHTDLFAWDFQITRPVTVLKFVTTPVRAMEWLFHRELRHAWQANDADLSFTQMRVAADVLGKLAHQSSQHPLRMLAEHLHHAVRWGAIRNLARINRSEALKLIEAAASGDPHPHVQRAAQKTLDQMRKS